MRSPEDILMRNRDYVAYVDSPMGGITLGSDGDRLTGLWFDGQKNFGSTLSEEAEEKSLPVFEETERWLEIYFGGKQPDFTPPLAPQGTDFRKAVWEILLTIPYGETMTYGEIARFIAQKKELDNVSAQAVGGAVGHNPISIIIPCHRVVGTGGSLIGYAGGLERKQWLLQLERGDS